MDWKTCPCERCQERRRHAESQGLDLESLPGNLWEALAQGARVVPWDKRELSRQIAASLERHGYAQEQSGRCEFVQHANHALRPAPTKPVTDDADE